MDLDFAYSNMRFIYVFLLLNYAYDYDTNKKGNTDIKCSCSSFFLVPWESSSIPKPTPAQLRYQKNENNGSVYFRSKRIYFELSWVHLERNIYYHS